MRAAISVSSSAAVSIAPNRSARTLVSSSVSTPALASSAALFPRPTSLIFDLEEEETSCQELPEPPVHDVCHELQCLATAGDQHWQLCQDASDVKEALTHGDKSLCVEVNCFAQALADRGHLVWIRKGTYTCPPGFGMGIVKHTFVVASLPSATGQPTYCVVDPNWQEHFQLSGVGTADYKQLLSLLPSVFVGGADQLSFLVNFLCKEMEKVFQVRGVSLPPWRSPRVMQGRWLVNQAEDERVYSNHSSPSTSPPRMVQAVAV